MHELSAPARVFRSDHTRRWVVSRSISQCRVFLPSGRFKKMQTLSFEEPVIFGSWG